MDVSTEPTLGICIADPSVRSRLTLFAHEGGATTRDMTLDIRQRPRCVAVIHDLSPWTDASIETFRAYRQQVPYLPFLLYLPAGSLRASVIGACAALRGVRLEVHKPPLAERSVLRQHIAWLLNAAPRQQLLHILGILFPDASPRLSALFRRALEHVGPGSVVPLASVAKSADALGVSRRSLEREVRRPKRMLLWITVLYVMLVARLSGRPPVDVAGVLGLARKRFHELCHTLLPEEHLASALSPDDLHWLLAAFVEEYRLPNAVADRAVAALSS